MLVANRRSMIRISDPLRREPLADSVVNHENIFLAKLKDSESTTRAPRRLQRLASASSVHRSIDVRTTESTATQALPAILTFADAGDARIFRVRLRALRRIVVRSLARVLSPPRQHFLKGDAVFFDVLVYSE